MRDGALIFFGVLLSLRAAWNCDARHVDFRHVDTTPPQLSLPQPPPDSTVQNPCVVCGKVSDEAGVDARSLRLLIDGTDVSAQATVDVEHFTWRPGSAMSSGVHRVEAQIADKAGNVSNRLTWRFGLDVPVTVKARFKGGAFLVNDQPYFPLTIFNRRCMVDLECFDESILSQAAGAGFNSIYVESGTERGLERALTHGVKQIALVKPDELRRCTDVERARDALVAHGPGRWRNYPAMLAYYADAPESALEAETQPNLPRPTVLKLLGTARQVLHEADPNHPVVWIQGWRDCYADYVQVNDALSTFFYPIRPGGMPLASVEDYDLVSARAAAREKPVWFIAQGFDFVFQNTGDRPSPGHLRPTAAEMRAMCYLALVGGVKGLTLYCSGETVDPNLFNDLTQYPEQWAAALKMASEIRYLSPVLLSGRRVVSAVKQPHYDVRFPAHQAQQTPSEAQNDIRVVELQTGNSHTMIAVNVTEFTEFASWSFEKPVQPKVLFEDRALAESATAFEDRFLPYEVHVYQWTTE